MSRKHELELARPEANYSYMCASWYRHSGNTMAERWEYYLVLGTYTHRYLPRHYQPHTHVYV